MDAVRARDDKTRVVIYSRPVRLNTGKRLSVVGERSHQQPLGTDGDGTQWACAQSGELGGVRGYLSGLLFPEIAVLDFDNVYDLPGD